MKWDQIQKQIKQYQRRKFDELIVHPNFDINSFYRIDEYRTFCRSKNISNEWIIEDIKFDDIKGIFLIALRSSTSSYWHYESDINNISKININKNIKDFKNRSIDLEEIRNRIEYYG